MKVSFIGAGSMGSLLAGALLRTGTLAPLDVTVSTRTSSKAEQLARQFPGLRIVAGNAEAAQQADIILLCVKPMDFRQVLRDIRVSVSPEQIIISITSPVTIEQLESLLPCKVAKIIPSIVNSVGGGASLFMFGTRLTPDDQIMLKELFAAISRPIEVPEEEVRVASDISSCGPAFMACLLEQFIDAAVEYAGMSRPLAEELAAEMLLGTARMLEQGCSTAELQSRVSVPGGITAAALEELRNSTKDAFYKVLQKTHAKFEEDLIRVEASLGTESFISD